MTASPRRVAAAIPWLLFLLGLSCLSRESSDVGDALSRDGTGDLAAVQARLAGEPFGDPDGCSNIWLYTFHREGRRAVSVWIDAVEFQLSSQPQVLDLAQLQDRSRALRVELLLFAESPGNYFCDDVLGDEGAVARAWNAVAGTVTASISRGPLSRHGDHAYRATVILEKVQFAEQRSYPGLTLEQLEFPSVFVGWLPG